MSSKVTPQLLLLSSGEWAGTPACKYQEMLGVGGSHYKTIFSTELSLEGREKLHAQEARRL